MKASDRPLEFDIRPLEFDVGDRVRYNDGSRTRLAKVLEWHGFIGATRSYDLGLANGRRICGVAPTRLTRAPEPKPKPEPTDAELVENFRQYARRMGSDKHKNALLARLAELRFLAESR